MSHIESREFCTVERDGHLTIVTINRPDVMNSTHFEADEELHEVWNEFAADDEQWVGIITGAGDKAFSTGNDLKMHAQRGVRHFPPTGFAGLTTRFDLATNSRTAPPPRGTRSGQRGSPRRGARHRCAVE